MWIKVWPVAVIAAAVTTCGRRRRAVATIASSSAVVAAVTVVCGGFGTLFGFVTAQSGRDLQIEAPVSTAWMWAAYAQSGGDHPAGHPVTRGSVRVFYDGALRTVEVRGPGTVAAGTVVTVLMPVVFVAVAALGWVALRRHPAATVFPSLATGLVLTLLVLDKVGSPQYQTWLAAPVVAGLVHEPTRVRIMAVAAWVAAALTDVIYPYLATELRAGRVLALTVLTARNALLVAMFAVATVTLIRLAASSLPVVSAGTTTTVSAPAHPA